MDPVQELYTSVKDEINELILYNNFLKCFNNINAKHKALKASLNNEINAAFTQFSTELDDIFRQIMIQAIRTRQAAEKLPGYPEFIDFAEKLTIDDYKEFWTNTEKYALRTVMHKGKKMGYKIENLEDPTWIIIIEDNEINHEVIHRMLNAGAKIIED